MAEDREPQRQEPSVGNILGFAQLLLSKDPVDWTRQDPWSADMAGNYVPSRRDRIDPVFTT